MAPMQATLSWSSRTQGVKIAYPHTVADATLSVNDVSGKSGV